jgi:hypothetical protein
MSRKSLDAGYPLDRLAIDVRFNWEKIDIWWRMSASHQIMIKPQLDVGEGTSVQSHSLFPELKSS